MIIMAFVLLLAGPSFAITIGVNHKDLGFILNNTTAQYPLINFDDLPYPANVSFLVLGDSPLSDHLTFSPQSLTVYPDSDMQILNVTVNPSGFSNGSHSFLISFTANYINSSEQSGINGNIIESEIAKLSFSTSTANGAEHNVTVNVTVPGETVYVGGGGGGSSVSIIRNVTIINATNQTVVTQSKNLQIRSPWLIIAVEGELSADIFLKNTGNVKLENLTLLLSSDAASLAYDPEIGVMYPGEEKKITVYINDLKKDINPVSILVSGDGEWRSMFVVQQPGAPLAKTDCIVVDPSEFIVEAGIPSPIIIHVKNNCNLPLHDIYMMVQGLAGEMIAGQLDGEMLIQKTVNFPEGQHDVKAYFVFEEGSSELVIHIKAIAPKGYTEIIILLIILAVVLVLYYRDLRKLRRTLERRESKLKKFGL